MTRNFRPGLVIACLAWPGCGLAQSVGYFMPPANPAVAARPVPVVSPLVVAQLLDDPPPVMAPPAPTASPWYGTDLGVLGIGLVATGVSLVLDHGVNQFAAKHTVLHGHQNNLLIPTDILEIAPLALAATTMFQSPLADPTLAHASSIAFTAAVEVTVEVQLLKYAVGRNPPGGANSDPYVAQPFDARKSSFGLNAILPVGGASDSSFPSGRTALTAALVTPYAEIYHQPWLYAVPVAVGVGRIAEGDRHWLSDSVAGGFLGWLTADLTRRFFPDSDYGLLLFGDGRQLQVGFSGRF